MAVRSTSHIASALRLPERTVRDWKKHKREEGMSESKPKRARTTLTPAQEETVCAWINYELRHNGEAVTCAKLRALVSAIFGTQYPTAQWSKGWLQGFMERNRLSIHKLSRHSVPSDSLHLLPSDIMRFWCDIRFAVEKRGPWDMILNIDETCVRFNASHPTTIAPIGSREVSVLCTDQHRFSCTVALVTTVRGHLYAPYIIFKNKSGSQLKVRERNGPPSPSPAVIMFQKSGFMNHELWMYVLKSLLERPDSTAFETYHSAATAPASAAASASAATATSASAAASALAPALAHVPAPVLPAPAPASSSSSASPSAAVLSRPRILLLADSFKCHHSDDAVAFCIANRCLLLTIPAHSTPFVQPNDQCVNSNFKRLLSVKLNALCAEFAHKHMASADKRAITRQAVEDACDELRLHPAAVQESYRKTGILAAARLGEDVIVNIAGETAVSTASIGPSISAYFSLYTANPDTSARAPDLADSKWIYANMHPAPPLPPAFPVLPPPALSATEAASPSSSPRTEHKKGKKGAKSVRISAQVANRQALALLSADCK